MEKYWIIVDGKPQGPFTPEQLKLRRDFTADLPVWTTGYADWTVASEVPTLAALLEEVAAEEEAAAAQSESAQQVFQQEEVFTQSTPAPESGFTPRASMAVSPAEGMPPSYLAWNIVMTLCCCMIVGIIGIVFSAQVNQKWQRGDIEGARKSSERAAWCFILSFVLGLVGMPFQLLIQSMSL